MATWDDDDTREGFHVIASMMDCAANTIDQAIVAADEDEDLTLLFNTRDWLRDRAALFSPPGEPQDGYNKGQGDADVINLEAYRVWSGIKWG